MLIETHAHLSHFKFEQSFRYLNHDRSSGTLGVVQRDRYAVIQDMNGTTWEA